MVQKNLQIHTENILPIIKKWLYSDKDIFIRELVCNACDALLKLKLLHTNNTIEPRIDIHIDTANKTLTFTDTGIGMTADEVEKYIAQIAFSGAEEFMNKYTNSSEKDHIIGHFGLGFYSAYMVSSKVDLETLSYQENATAALWSCDGSTTYTLTESSRTQIGTSITLHLDAESHEYIDPAKIRSILQKYCAYLPFPIYLEGARINDKDPLWLKSPNDCTENDYLEFYRSLYPMDPDPLFWIHLNVDYPFTLQGILYFPKIHRRFDWNQNNIKLFCNRVFVSDSCKEIIPDYLMCLKGALDSPNIPLNVSRSTLQMDRTVRQLSTHISKKITDRLSQLYDTEKETFYTIWPDVELTVKLGILQDDKFYDRARPFLIWKTLSGTWTTLEGKTDKIFYIQDEKVNTPLLDLYTQKGIDILLATHPVDTPLLNYLEDKLRPATFQRIDGAIDPALLDTSREKTLLDPEGKTEAGRIADYIRSCLQIPVEAKSLASDTLPAFLVVDEDMRRMRDSLQLSGQSLPLGDKRTFVVNTNSPLISSLYALKDKNPTLAEKAIQHLYDLSLLGQKELSPQDLPSFLTRAHTLLSETLGLNK